MGATGFLARFVDGFESPPHIHNVSYRAIVIHGEVHNAHPSAEKMWMPSGSFWTQPKGLVHITAARGSGVVALVEIDEGPYLVRSVDDAFSNEETPVNIPAAELVWAEANSTALPSPAGTAHGTPQLSTLWGNPSGGSTHGALAKLPSGFTGAVRTGGSTLDVVVIRGSPVHQPSGRTDGTTLAPGSYLQSSDAGLRISCVGEEDCLLYVRGAGQFVVTPEEVES